MPLESLRSRATEALRVLGAAQNSAVSAELRVGPLCDALLAVRDLLLCYGDRHSLVPGHHHEAKSLGVLQVLGAEMSSLISALEIVSSRSAAIVELDDSKDGQSQKEGHHDGKGDHDGPEARHDGRSPTDGDGAQ